jgi:beta-glucosidase
MGFRKDFAWGGASASYQIEGAAFEDGKGRLSGTCSAVTGPDRRRYCRDVACDHYHLMKKMLP